jgi:hypothetical protein
MSTSWSVCVINGATITNKHDEFGGDFARKLPPGAKDWEFL